MLRKHNVFLVFTAALTFFIIPCLGYHTPHSNLNLIRKRRQSTTNCRRQFQCDNNECIEYKKVCDGEKDCTDGSDELSELCKKPPRKLSCNETEIENGYMSVIAEDHTPGTPVPNNSFVNFTCNAGYTLTPKIVTVVGCINGAWNLPLPKCKITCSPRLSTEILEVTCSINDKTVNCNEPLVEGAVALSKCKNIYNDFSLAMCVKGQWDTPPIRCELECGKTIPDSSDGFQLSVDGEKVKTGKFPWHVGIYQLENKEYKYKCGGSIISPLIVISAAHCFNRFGKSIPAEEFVVGAGKYYSDFMSSKDLLAQKRQVKEYHIPPQFAEGRGKIAGDVAVVIVNTPFETTLAVSPVCMDLDGNRIEPNRRGNVAGWRYEDPTQELKTFNTPYMNAEQCANDVPSSFKRYVTSDKFCGGVTNETEICKGYSGSGIVFENGQKQYLRGVLVRADDAGVDVCGHAQHAVYTNLTSYNGFIKKVVRHNPVVDKAIPCQPRISSAIIVNCTSKGEPVDCNKPVPDGTVAIAMCKNFYTSTEGEQTISISTCSAGSWDKPIIECEPECGEVVPDGDVYITSGQNATRGKFPWPVGIYRMNDITLGYSYYCGGTIITPSIVLTVATCFKDVGRETYAPKFFYVGAGKYFGRFDSEEDKLAQKRQVKRIIYHPTYQGYYGNYEYDIAVLELNETLEMTNVVRPVCVDWNKAIDFKDNDIGVVVGWGLDDPDRPFHSSTLQQLNGFYISREKCLELAGEAFASLVTKDKICAGYTNGSSLCPGDNGDGLVFEKNRNNKDKYFLAGIASLRPNPIGTCLVNEYTEYTSIAAQLPFIKIVIKKLEELKAKCPPRVSDSVHVRCTHNGKLIDCSQSVNGTVAISTCQEYYKSTINSSISVSTCTRGSWDKPLIQCVQTEALQNELCPPRESEAVNMKCVADDKPVNCTKPMKEGTVVISECKELYTPAFGDISISISRCSKGYWNNPLIQCKPLQPLAIECGEVIPNGETFAVNANTAKRGEFPWHVGLYRLVKQQHDYKCGGSIITPLAVITAAHCFTNQYGSKYPPEEFYVAAGKYYSDYNAKEDCQAQKRQVKDYHIPPAYRGYETNFQGDLAVTIMMEAFELTNIVQPVCIEWGNTIELQQLRPSNRGNVVGWGTVNQYDASKASRELKQLTAPFIDVDQCLNNVPKNFRRWVTSDKFCAGYTNGSSVCKGDSGGGMVFEWNAENKQKYYIRGVVSVGPTDKSKSLICDNNKYGAYTKVSFYKRFIINIINTISEESNDKV